ncbi:transforming growth factor beta-1-induced transcript 1 protein isoform X5 [Oncorhynchus mykiss]|uniref:transforming growth factor beta-1-induced transcript 1 protein isoform X5 n=3 Tax=Oncorhynchus TaxID=8016 RepID=UPI000B4F61D5|nr:transforming growth factor beta-1-induced transcript 1 protein isoform X5 [Oncorhynchus mykiss]XP_031655714.1 transforming growth factor beta-1-induced transcript 1 protein isoform X4 [Oncorhynchus kisutch]XP_031655715.1 transforming growth factor beta-1-induced transcript 1 protein isoform X4 [Oncorhynchus kisutch]XP_031655716.1 transforming growth factor beta-1-induced transcript 1 protein isoform X4 [Oncorhynchus kisutch]XP_031655717.1 transforming growth factor beta-1-induced transcript 
MKSNGSQNPNPDKQLYSTVNKPRSPRTADPPPPAFSSSSVLGGGLSELDHLLQELNATQFNITDEILAQFPTTKKDERDKIKEFQGSKDKVTTPYPSSVKPSATSATLELDKLMASLSDFRVQSTNATEFKTAEPQSHAVYCDVRRPRLDNSQLNEPAPAVTPVITVPQHPVPPPQASSGGSLDSMLGLLQSDLTRQGVPTSSKGSCSACQKPVVGQVVTALGRVWHPEHFVCSECETELGSRNFFEKDGQPYCESDYFTLYSPHCAHCNKPILNKMVTALDKNWHPECFCCVKCSRAFGEEGFHDREGQQYCQQCFLSLFASRCQGCTQPILENYISALNSLWHPQCFVCRECYCPFVNGSFFEHEGQPLCEAHYHQSRGSMCQACQQPILGRCVTAMGAKFHPHHLVCHFCLKPLSKGCFKEQENKPYCHPCFIKLFG